MEIDLLLEPASSGHLRNCSFWHFHQLHFSALAVAAWWKPVANKVVRLRNSPFSFGCWPRGLLKQQAYTVYAYTEMFRDMSHIYIYISWCIQCPMSPMGLPEQVRSTMEEVEYGVAQSFRADPSLKHSGLMFHAGLSVGNSILWSTETAVPQSSSLQAAFANFRFQAETITAVLQSPSFTSSAPAQRPAPLTSLTGSKQKQESHR